MNPLWKTKTFWSGVASVATGIGLCVAGEYEQGIVLIGMGVLAICGRDAVRKVENGQKK